MKKTIVLLIGLLAILMVIILAARVECPSPFAKPEFGRCVSVFEKAR